MNYIGDISKNDFLVLQEAATKYKNILEFGVGASTQVILNYTSGSFVSIDTSQDWIDITKKNIEFLNINKPLDILTYDEFKPSGSYDFVFNDGVDHLRSSFGIFIFPYIQVGGVLAYHDTRRGGDMMNVLELVKRYFNEIDVIEMNKNNSNITFIRKKQYQPYEEWNVAEGKISLPKGGSVFKDTPIPPHMM